MHGGSYALLINVNGDRHNFPLVSCFDLLPNASDRFSLPNLRLSGSRNFHKRITISNVVQRDDALGDEMSSEDAANTSPYCSFHRSQALPEALLRCAFLGDASVSWEAFPRWSVETMN